MSNRDGDEMTETGDEYVSLVRKGSIAVLTLCRPDKLNAWSWEAAQALTDRAREVRFDSSVRAVILNAEGRAFCAGMDFTKIGKRAQSRSPGEKVRDYYENFRDVHERFGVLCNLPQPVVVAIQGYCLGAGLELAMLGDIRIAADDAQFALPEVQLGVGIDGGADLRLVNEIGPAWTKLLATTGRRIDAAKACEIGIVQEVVPGDELQAQAVALAEEIAANAPIAVQGVKRTIDMFAERGMADALRFEALSASTAFATDDMTEGARAMAEKRKPDFEGK